MSLSFTGGLCGLAGAVELLFGAMNNGATYMQFAAGLSNNTIVVLQAFIVIFVGAPAIMRSLLKRKET